MMAGANGSTIRRWGRGGVAALLVACTCAGVRLGQAAPAATRAATRPGDGNADRSSLLVTTDTGEVGKLLRYWYSHHTAAGNVGDHYDNRDRGHSMLRMKLFPQLELVTYTDQAKARRLDWGLQYRMLFKRPTFGNSSTASTRMDIGSNVRWGMTTGTIPNVLYRQYVGSNLYIYPEHRDFDPGHNGRGGYGDLFPANIPYTIVSRGSSGSDQRFMEAVAFTLAALRPDTKKRLVETGLLMPTLQMIFRSCNRSAAGQIDYLTGRAHPSAFASRDLDPLAMVRMAHAMEPNDVPPMVQLRVVEDVQGNEGRDWFDPGRGEKLFTTPCAIARIGRSVQRVRRMVVSAEGSYDINKRPLSYHWVVLRGDPNAVRIKPVKDDYSVVELLIPFTAPRPIWPDSDIDSPRVDIGAFVKSGKRFSAPGFVTMYFLPNEARTYDSRGRIAEVDYNFGDSTIGYPSSKPRTPDYDVADWKPLLDAAGARSDNLVSRLLAEHLSAAQRAELEVVARQFDAALIREAKARTACDNALARQDEAKRAVTQAGKAYYAAKRTGDKEKIAAAERALRTRRVKEKAAYDFVVRAQRAYQTAKTAGSDLLTLPRPRLGRVRVTSSRRVPIADRTRVQTARECVERAINAVKDDPTLYTAHAAEIAKLLQAAPAADADAIRSARDELVRGGVLAGDDATGWRLTPLLDGNAPPAERLSVSQRNRLAWFHIELIQRLLLPGSLRMKFVRNFVPSHLTRDDKTWRDVYHYDKAGKLTGWTRHAGDKTTRFDAEGKQAQ